MIKRLRLPSLSALSWVVAFLLIACNILLVRQNSRLRLLARKLESEQRIQVGDKLGPLRGIDLEGRPVDLNFTENNLKTIVLFSSVSCPYCQRQNPQWNQLADQVDPRKYEVIELFRNDEARNEVAAYLQANGFRAADSGKVFLIPAASLREEKLNATPITLIIGKNSVVEKVWFGLWNESATREVNSFLDISIQPE